MNSVKLIITDRGDPSVGLFPQSWEVDVPHLFENDKDSLEFFREKIIEAYKDFCEGRCIAEYDFELKYPDDFD